MLISGLSRSKFSGRASPRTCSRRAVSSAAPASSSRGAQACGISKREPACSKRARVGVGACSGSPSAARLVPPPVSGERAGSGRRMAHRPTAPRSATLAAQPQRSPGAAEGSAGIGLGWAGRASARWRRRRRQRSGRGRGRGARGLAGGRNDAGWRGRLASARQQCCE